MKKANKKYFNKFFLPYLSKSERASRFMWFVFLLGTFAVFLIILTIESDILSQISPPQSKND